MPGIVDTLLFRFIGNTSHLTKNIASARSALQGLTGSAFKTKAIIVGGMVAIGVAALIAFRKSVAAIAALDAGLREVSTLLPGTVDGLNGVRQALIDLSTRVGEPPEMLSKAFYQSVSAGFTNLADSMSIVEASSKAAVAGLTSTEVALDGITTVLNAYGLTAEDATRISDILFSTVAEGKIRFGELSSNIGTVAATAKIVGVDIEEVAAAIASLTKNTGQVEESFTALNRLLLGFAKNSKEAREFAEELDLDLSAERLAGTDLLTVLEEIGEAAGGDAEAFAKLFPNLRQFKAVVVLATEGLDDYKKALDRVKDSTGATQTAFNEVNKGLDQQKKILGQTLNKLWLQLGTVTLPIAIAAYASLNKELLSIFDKEELRIQRLEKLGRTEEANALRKIQLELEFQKQLDKTIDKQNTALSKLIQRLELARPGNFVADILNLGNEEQEKSIEAFRKVTAQVRKMLRASDFRSLGIDEKRAVTQNAINLLRESETDLIEDQLEYAQEYQLDLEDVLDNLDNQVLVEETLARIREGLPPRPDDDDDDPPGGGDDAAELEAYLKKLQDARDAVTEFGERIASLKEFGLEIGDEVPGAVAEYLSAMESVSDEFDKQVDAFVLLAAAGDAQAQQALEQSHLLEDQRHELEANRDAIIDGLRYIEQFGDTIVDVMKEIPDSQRGILKPALSQLEFALAAAERAREELSLLEEGTDEHAAALKKYASAEAQAKKAFDAVRVILKALVKDGGLLKKILDELDAKWKELFGGKELTEGTTDWKKIGETIEASARAALSLADALGIVDEKTSKVLTGFVDIGDAISKIASGNLLAGVIQGIGGIVGVVGGLFGGGDNEAATARAASDAEYLKAQEERQSVLEENSARLLELSRNVSELAGIMGGTKGSTLVGLGDVFDAAFANFDEAMANLETIDFSGPYGNQARAQAAIEIQQQFFDDLNTSLAAAGLTLADLEGIADAAGINIDTLLGVLSGELPMSITNMEDAFLQAADAAELLAAQTVDKLFTGFEGELDLLRLNIGLLEDEFGDVNKQISEFQRILRDTAGIDLSKLDDQWRGVFDDLLNADISTPEGRTAAEAAIEAIIRGAKDLPREAFGELTSDQFFDFLSEWESLLDSAAEELGGGPDATSFQVFRGMTEVTGNRIAGLLTTDTYWNRQTALHTQQMVGLLGGTAITTMPPEAFLQPFSSLTAPSLEELATFIASAMPPQIVIDSFEINFTLEGDVLDEETARTAGRVAAEEFDRELGDSYVIKRRSFGTRPVRTS